MQRHNGQDERYDAVWNDYLRRASVYIFDVYVCEWSTLIYIKYVIVQICGMNGHYQTPLRIVLIFLKMYEKGEDC